MGPEAGSKARENREIHLVKFAAATGDRSLYNAARDHSLPKPAAARSPWRTAPGGPPPAGPHLHSASPAAANPRAGLIDQCKSTRAGRAIPAGITTQGEEN